MLVEVDAPGELAQALITMLEDTVRASEMGNEGRKRAVELYSWEARAERLKSVYQKLRPGTRVHVSTKIMSH